jgi:signal transduction histidine kinase
VRPLRHPHRLRHALDNLLDNAIRVTGSGGSLRVVAEWSGEGMTLTVADTGPGVAYGFLARARAGWPAGSGLQ